MSTPLDTLPDVLTEFEAKRRGWIAQAGAGIRYVLERAAGQAI